jgi:hypothetical protein
MCGRRRRVGEDLVQCQYRQCIGDQAIRINHDEALQFHELRLFSDEYGASGS